jgi:Domain of Unknown Function with PDB structure (DUF3858)/Domain of Unknown Function with PDB structure (DUF3857)
MNYNCIVTVLLFISFLLPSVAQERKFGDITLSELQETKDTVFPDAPAVVLYRDIDFSYGNSLHVHERIKIYTAAGFDYSDWTIRFDDVKALKGATYNLENGKIIAEKVSDRGIFKEKISEDEEISKLTFPNVKEGSIIELKYKVIFIGFSTLYSQGHLPIKYQRINIENGYYGNLSIRENQYVKLPIKRVSSGASTQFIGENIPPLRDEAYVANVNNHRGKILMERHGVTYQQTWASVAKRYKDADWFGKQLRKGDALYKKDLKDLLGDETDTLQIAKKIDRFVKDNIEWNNLYSRGSEYVKTIYRDAEGDSGDINLLLVHMLKSRGLNAYPMLVATKNKGWLMYPNFNAFNAVLAAVKIDGVQYLLDGSQKNAAFGQIPLRYVNDRGLFIFDDGSYEIYPIILKEPSKNTLIVNVALDLDALAVRGNAKKQLTNYEAFNFREYYADLENETYEESLNEIDFFTASNVEKKEVDNPEKPVRISFDFEMDNYLEQIDDAYYLEPLLIWGLNENKFIEEDRLYPIDFEYPFAENYIINYTIPEGYKIESLPDPKLVKMEEDIGDMLFNIQQRGNEIQVLFTLNFNHYLIPADYYPALQSLYSEYLNTSKSKIVLSKK